MMRPLHFGRDEVNLEFAAQSWQRVLFGEFASNFTSETRPFPCVFGVNGFRSNQLRFAFPDPLNAHVMGPILRDYLKNARSYGMNTSLVAFSRPGPVASMEAYRSRFWSLLADLVAVDCDSWPETIPEKLDDPHWEFCFAGEPVFVVCCTPAHVLRQSRHSSSFMLTFQPRWVFERILGSSKSADRAASKVRERLEPFDLIGAAPVLGWYGETDNREYRQYFIDDTNDEPSCPFASLGRQRQAREADSLQKKKEDHAA